MCDAPVDWMGIWGPRRAHFNESSGVFEVGAVNNSTAELILVATGNTLMPPYIVSKDFSTATFPGTDMSLLSTFTLWGGLSVLLLEDVCTSLNLRCRIAYVPPSGANGNGSPSIDVLLDEAARIVFTPLVADGSLPKSELLQHLHTLHYWTVCTIIHETHMHDRVTPVSALFLSIFDTSTWVTMIGAFLLSFIVYALSRIIYSRWTNDRLSVTHEGFVWIYEMFTSDFTLMFEKVHGKVVLVLFCVWMILQIVITNGINCRLITMMTVSKPKSLPFTTIKELLDSDWQVLSTVAIKSTLLKSVNDTEKLLGQRIQTTGLSRPHFFSVIHEKSNDKVAILLQKEYLELLAEQKGDRFIVVIPEVLRLPVGIFWFRSNDSLLANFVKTFNHLRQSGVTDSDRRHFESYVLLNQVKFMDRRNFKQGIAKPIHHQNVSSQRGLALADFLTPVVFLLCLLLFSAFIFGCEMHQSAIPLRCAAFQVSV